MSTPENEPRWLSAQEQVDWRAFLDGFALLMDSLNRRLEEDAHLSLAEYEVLVRLSEAPERAMRMSDLADDLVHSRSRLTHTVNRMEKRGLVTREAYAQDRRGVVCVLADEGFARLVGAAPSHVASVRTDLMDHLTPHQFHALGKSMGKIASALRTPQD